jgi:hypothetical protein
VEQQLMVRPSRPHARPVAIRIAQLARDRHEPLARRRKLNKNQRTIETGRIWHCFSFLSA